MPAICEGRGNFSAWHLENFTFAFSKWLRRTKGAARVSRSNGKKNRSARIMYTALFSVGLSGGIIAPGETERLRRRDGGAGRERELSDVEARARANAATRLFFFPFFSRATGSTGSGDLSVVRPASRAIMYRHPYSSSDHFLEHVEARRVAGKTLTPAEAMAATRNPSSGNATALARRVFWTFAFHQRAWNCSLRGQLLLRNGRAVM